ncbi:MAG: UDP-3-O-(3-hydroxymyristoyl)glucosamine N-acyltransferase [Phycisphaerales bacterium]|nr:UDP-3-O-(3-hydroxymyristoyl)glucosamine N-acyltransferase [Phycisphaerales bacterium]
MITAGELAKDLGAELRGDAELRLQRVAPLEEADADCLSWVGAARYAKQLATTRAGAVLAPAAMTPPPHTAHIVVADADLALCEALRRMAPPTRQLPPGVHSTAVVATDATIEEGAAVGPYVVIGPRVRVGPHSRIHAGCSIGEAAHIGAHCELWPNVVVREYCRLGDRVIIHPNATIGADGFGYIHRDGRHVHVPQIGIVVIEDDVEIGANSCVDRARSAETRIGRGTKIDNLVQVGHNVRIGEHCVLVGGVAIGGSTRLGKYVTLAGQVGVPDHMEIGDFALVMAQAGVMKNVPAKARVSGTPAIEHGAWIHEQGALRRLPQMLEELRALRKRVEALESTTDHR